MTAEQGDRNEKFDKTFYYGPDSALSVYRMPGRRKWKWKWV
jgi:hypothetical protein